MRGTHSTAERFPTRRNRTCFFDKILVSIVVNPCAIIVFPRVNFGKSSRLSYINPVSRVHLLLFSYEKPLARSTSA